MIPARINGTTRVLGAPVGWTPEASGPCLGLPIRDEMSADQPCMVSAWEPTPAELAAIMAGATIKLRIVGRGHPPVWLYVEGVEG
jgi:hypothetical protein